jgi:tetratricopeptide (TPR) repeat protein
MRSEWAEIVNWCNLEGVFAFLRIDSLFSNLLSCLIKAHEIAGEFDDAITVTEAWIAKYPDELGTHERMARLYQKKGDFSAAYSWLRKEADRNPTFGEDSNISMILALGSIASPAKIDEALEALANRHRPEQNLVASVIENHWPTFAKLAKDSKERWVTGTWLLATPTQNVAPGIASHCFAWVVERELRSTIFEPFAAFERERRLEPHADVNEQTRVLIAYLNGTSPVTLGQMLYILGQVRKAQFPTYALFTQWLNAGLPSFLARIDHINTYKITEFRNREDHAKMQNVTRTEAEEMNIICRDLVGAIHRD